MSRATVVEIGTYSDDYFILELLPSRERVRCSFYDRADWDYIYDYLCKPMEFEFIKENKIKIKKV